jgi:hypothetical protein
MSAPHQSTPAVPHSRTANPTALASAALANKSAPTAALDPPHCSSAPESAPETFPPALAPKYVDKPPAIFRLAETVRASRSRQISSFVGRTCPIRCTVTRRLSPLLSTSNTRRTTFRSSDHKCSRHLLLSPETEYFPCPESNITAPSSITTAPLLPERNPSSSVAKVPAVIPEVSQMPDYPVCDE